MTTTKYLQLPIPSKSDRGKIITECLDPAFTKMDQKIESIDSNIDFNLLATLGIPYGGILNNTNAKVAGTAYYDTANKKIYKCTTNTSINYADAAYFEEISNNDLLGKLQNLTIAKSLLTSTVTRLEVGSSPIQIGKVTEGFKYICFTVVSFTSLKAVFVNTNIMQLQLSNLRVLTHVPSLANLHGIEVYILNDLIYIRNLTNTEANLIYDLKTFG
ncbi:MAG: hypothetical protein ACRC4T_25110 [Cetobacterium sp.]